MSKSCITVTSKIIPLFHYHFRMCLISLRFHPGEGEKQKKLPSEVSKKEASEGQTLPSKEATDATSPSEHNNKPTETEDEKLTEANLVSSGDSGQATVVEGEQKDQGELGHQEDGDEPGVCDCVCVCVCVCVCACKCVSC